MHKLGGESFEIEVFFDGGCPLCAREMNSLRHRDKSHGIKITDIHDRGFDPGDHGKSLGELMAQMHGRLPDGTWLRGVEVFRRLYHAIGCRWLVGISRLPLISQMMDASYWVFAKNRLPLTGRCAGGSCSTKAATAAK
jgi:predicted DCC family thiol-disulfide oxidoreductase YuxK